MTDTLATIGFRADTRDLDQADVKLKKLGSTGEQTERKINDANKGMSDSFRSSTAAVSALTAGLGALAATVSVGQVIQYSDGWKSFNNVLRQVTTSEADFIKTQQSVLALAKQTNSNLLSTAELYGELTRATSDLGLSSERVLGVTGTINKLFLAGGKSAAEASGSIRQLAQALAAGALRGDEFNSVAEGAPRILDALAKQLNMTRGELREFAATGGITAEIMVKALEGYATEADKMVGVTQRTFAQTNEIIQANITEWVGSSKSLQAVTESVGSSLLSVSENLEPLARALGVGASILGGAWVLSAGRAAAANIALGAATAGVTTATYALTAATRLLMGPLGLVITATGAAAIAFDSYAKDADSARLATEKLNQEWERSSNAARAQQYVAAQQRIIDIERQLIEEEKKLQEAMKQTGTGMFGNTTATANQARVISELGKEKADLQAKIEGMNKAFDNSIPPITGQTMAVKAATKSAKELRAEISRIADLEEEMEDAFGGEDMLTEVYQNRAKAAEKLMDEWSEGVDTFQSQGQAIDSLVTSVTNLGGAWSSSGSAMIDAFGSAADVIDDYIKRVGEVSDLEVKLKAVRDDSSSSAIDKSKAEVALLDLQYQGQRANLSMLSKTAGAAASMFKEQSKERKALHMAEKAFAAVEIALAMQKAGASAVAAIANQGTGDPYTAFARIAAMMGIMAGLGVFSGGGGGGGYSAPTSGTGTVTGDSEAKSGSIGNASDEFKDIALDQLFELQGIRESMNQLAGGIANLAVSLIRSSSFGGGNAVGIGKSQAVSAPSFMQEFGDKFSAIDPLIGVFDGVLNKVLAGVFGTTKKTLIDTGLKFDSQSIADILSNGFNGYYYNVIETTKKKMFGLSKKTSTGTELQDVESGILAEIGSVFGFLANSISGAIDALGVTATNSLRDFVVNLGSVSFKDMTGDEIQKELEAMFSQQGDLMAEYVFPHIKQYQQMGEGALETLMRVSKEQAMFDDGLNKIGQSLSSASRIMQIDVAHAIATMMGGMDEFASKTNQYFKAFFSESEQFDYLAKSLAEAMSGIGLPMVSSREGFRSIVDGLDLTTESGQRMFATLMQLVPGMDDYFNAIEKQKAAAEAAAEAARKEAEAKAAALKAQGLDLQLRLYDALGQSAEALALRRQMELDATDETLRALLLQIYAAEDAAAAQRELASAQETAAQAARDAASAAIDAAQNAFGKLQESAQREKDRLGAELDLKLEAINAEKDLLKQQRDSVIDGYQEQGKAVEQYINKLEGLNDILTGFLSDTGTQANPFKELAMIYNEAKAGLLPDSSRLSSVLSGVSGAGSAGFGSAFEQNRAMAVARNQAAGIQGIVGGAMGGAKSQLQWIEYQATAADEYYIAQLAKLDVAAKTAQKLHDEQVGKIDEQLTEAQKQLNALLGVDDRLLTIDQALIEFYAAMNAANELGLGVASEQVAAINRVEAAIVQVGQQIVEITKPDGRVWVPPTMPDRFTTDGKVVTQEMLDVLTQILHAQEATAKHTKTTADVVELNQYEAQEVAL